MFCLFLKPICLNTKPFNEKYDNSYESLFQTMNVPFSDFKSDGSNNTLNGISSIKFLFDKSMEGKVVIDNIGIQHPLN